MLDASAAFKAVFAGLRAAHGRDFSDGNSSPERSGRQTFE